MHLFVGLLVMSTFYSSVAVSIKIVSDCDPRPLITQHEGRKPCVYVDKQNIKKVGVGYKMQNPNAQRDFQTIGADLEKFNNGLVTSAGETCNCSRVPCLKDEQMDELLDLSVKAATGDAGVVIKTLSSVCCSVQNAIVDMSFTLGGEAIPQLTTFANMIDSQNWKAAAKDLAVSNWCVGLDTTRCAEASDTIARGCPCNSTLSHSSSCCPPYSSFPCCHYSWCCHIAYGVCCSLGNTCCHPEYPVCCADADICCSTTFPVCCIEPRGVSYCCSAQYPVCLGNGQCGRATTLTRTRGVSESIEGSVGQKKFQKP